MSDAPAQAIAARIAAALPEALPPQQPFVIGLAGAQGSGKSTVASLLADRLRGDGRSVAILSLDDLYLDRAERAALAARVHPLFVTRGVPGTHDPLLGRALIDALGATGPVPLPRFDKATDRRGSPERIVAPVDVLILEGWCVGAPPQTAAALATPVNPLEAEEDRDGRWRRHANDALAGDYAQLFARIDFLVLLAAPGFDVVLGWRREQEQALRRRGAGGMDDAALARFVAHYRRLTNHMLAVTPAHADLVVPLRADRTPI